MLALGCAAPGGGDPGAVDAGVGGGGGGGGGGTTSNGTGGAAVIPGTGGTAVVPGTGGTAVIPGAGGTAVVPDAGGTSAGGSPGDPGSGGAPASRCEGSTSDAPLGTWTPMLKMSARIRGNGLVGDPAIPSDFYAFYQNRDAAGETGHVLKSTDFGVTWQRIDQTQVNGNAWGVAIDPNPNRCLGKNPCPPPTMYKPAGYGFGNADGDGLGLWKSVDGGVTWTSLFKGLAKGVLPKKGGGTTLVPPDKNNIHIDFYQVHILPDDPPNHILLTYHYGQVLLESTDGGATWDVHSIPWGSSHYVHGIDAKTWIVIAQQFDSPGGTYRTTTAGRVDGAIATAAWTKVDSMLHCHGAFTPWTDPCDGSLYFGGSEGIKRSRDGGATWESVVGSGNLCTVIGSRSYVYASTLFGSDTRRVRLASTPATWDKMTVDWGDGVAPYAAASSFDPTRGAWVILQFSYGSDTVNGDIWRLVEAR